MSQLVVHQLVVWNTLWNLHFISILFSAKVNAAAARTAKYVYDLYIFAVLQDGGVIIAHKTMAFSSN